MPSLQHGHAEAEVAELRRTYDRALLERDTMNLAKGILMERYGLTTAAALSVLVLHSQRDACSLAAAADRVVKG